MNGGIILIDKASGMTSFDCDKLVRKVTGIRKVGHSGTLDPFATGLLPVFVGDALKFMRYTDGYDKSYICEALFGAVSDTGDSEGVITRCERVPSSDDFGAIRSALLEVASRELQTPPKYSAKKINGQKAYDLARRGVDFELEPVKIKIYSLDIMEMTAADDGVRVRFSIHCSKGTYIRTVCTDAGEISGFGAYATGLRRTKCGPLCVEDAVSASAAATGEYSYIDPIITLTDMPEVALSERNASDIGNGKKIPARFINGFCYEPGTLYKATYGGKLIAVIYVDDGIVRIDRGFA